jgi:serine/threonine protein phosphatase 1
MLCFIRGNHDELLHWLEESKDNLLWYNHGGEATVNAYKTVDTDTKLRHIEFLATLKDYYLDDKNRLFVHTGFTNMNGVKYEFYPKLFYGIELYGNRSIARSSIKPNDLLYPKRLTYDRSVYRTHSCNKNC